MRRGPVGGTERPGQLEAIGSTRRPGQCIRAEVSRQLVMQALAGPARHPIVAPGRRTPRDPTEMPAQPVQHPVQRGVADQVFAGPGQGGAGHADRHPEGRVVVKRGREARRATGCVGQAGSQPALRQIEHAVGEAARRPGLPVMGLPGLDQDDPAGRAALASAAAEEVLHTVVGDADQPIVMAMQVVGMRGEAGLDRLHAGRLVVHQPDTVGGGRRDSGRSRAGDPGDHGATQHSPPGPRDRGTPTSSTRRPGWRWVVGPWTSRTRLRRAAGRRLCPIGWRPACRRPTPPCSRPGASPGTGRPGTARAHPWEQALSVRSAVAPDEFR